MERGGLLGTTRRWWPLCVISRTSCSTSKRSTGYSTPARQPSLSSHLAFGRTRAQAARAFARATEVAEKHLPHRHPFRFAVTSASGLGPPLPHLRRDWARPCHICAGTGRTPVTSFAHSGPCHACTPAPHGLRSPHGVPVPSQHSAAPHRCLFPCCCAQLALRPVRRDASRLHPSTGRGAAGVRADASAAAHARIPKAGVLAAGVRARRARAVRLNGAGALRSRSGSANNNKRAGKRPWGRFR